MVESPCTDNNLVVFLLRSLIVLLSLATLLSSSSTVAHPGNATVPESPLPKVNFSLNVAYYNLLAASREKNSFTVKFENAAVKLNQAAEIVASAKAAVWHQITRELSDTNPRMGYELISFPRDFPYHSATARGSVRGTSSESGEKFVMVMIHDPTNSPRRCLSLAFYTGANMSEENLKAEVATKANAMLENAFPEWLSGAEMVAKVTPSYNNTHNAMYHVQLENDYELV